MSHDPPPNASSTEGETSSTEGAPSAPTAGEAVPSPVVASSPAAVSSPFAVEAVRSFGDVEGEYAALRHGASQSLVGGAIVVDRSYRSRGTFAGAKARDVLTGLVTNDVLALSAGNGCYAVALTPKGKIIADVRIFVRDDDVQVDVPPRAAAGWWAMVRKFVNPRLSRYADVSAATCEVGVFGTRAHAVVAAALALPWEELAHMAPFAHRSLVALGHAVLVARVPDLGIEGFSLFVSPAGRDALWEALRAHGAHAAGLDALEIARVESGRPEWGIEMDDSTLAQEARMDELHAISYTKGCYTGQETVARVHFRGHVNRYLRGLRYDEAFQLPAHAEVQDGAGKVVGDIRSAVISPRLGGVAIAMLRRDVDADGEVAVVWDSGRVQASVVELPFPLG
jgi:tRNA-modifying protein YgfZ